MIPYSTSWGSCQRMYYLANYLQTNDFNVTLVHYKGDYYGNFGGTVLFNSIPITNKLIDFLISKKTKQTMRFKQANNKGQDNNKSQDNNKGQEFNKYIRSHLKLIIHSLDRFFYNEPPGNEIDGAFFIKMAKKDIMDIIYSKNISYVIISGPPFALFYSAKVLRKKNPNIKIILDYRDPWNLGNRGSFISNRKEREYLNLADRIIFSNDIIMEDTLNLFNIDRKKCDTIFNGFSEQSWEYTKKMHKEINSDPDKLILLYTGALSFDPTKLFEAIENFNHKDIIKVRFVGLNENEKIKVQKIRTSIDLEFIPIVSHERSLEYMIESDALILMYENESISKYWLTGKLFDYARSGKTILGIGNENAYFIKFIKKYMIGITALNNVSSIESALESIYYNWQNGTISESRGKSDRNFEYISEYSRENQNNKYLNIIKKL